MVATRKRQMMKGGADAVDKSETAKTVRTVIRGHTKQLLHQMRHAYSRSKQLLGSMVAGVSALADQNGCDPDNAKQVSDKILPKLNGSDGYKETIEKLMRVNFEKVGQIEGLLKNFQRYCTEDTYEIPAFALNTSAAEKNIDPFAMPSGAMNQEPGATGATGPGAGVSSMYEGNPVQATGPGRTLGLITMGGGRRRKGSRKGNRQTRRRVRK